jgi:hypothetical protein
MVRQLLAALLLCVCSHCTKVQPFVPGELGIQFSGMWRGQPHMKIHPQPYPFLVRLTGFIPPEAYAVLVENSYGQPVAQSAIMFNDVMQINPVRNYQFHQVLNHKSCESLRELELKKQEEDDSKLTIEQSAPNLYSVDLNARVATQAGKMLAQATYTIHLHCEGLGMGV